MNETEAALTSYIMFKLALGLIEFSLLSSSVNLNAKTEWEKKQFVYFMCLLFVCQLISVFFICLPE